jgi:hypothetical protein
MARRRPTRVWFDDANRTRSFERGAHQIVDYRRGVQTKGPTAGLYYRFGLDVPGEGIRPVRVLFRRDSPTVVRVTVVDDGPQDSPHRYTRGELCMWRRDAPRDSRWVVADGLVELIGHVHAHLMREAWWRRTGEWAGPEAVHDDVTPDDKDQAA